MVGTGRDLSVFFKTHGFIMRQKSIKRKINGILLLDKPKGFTSNAALQKIKKLFNAKKAGHTGSLDPLATGMLPLCFGEATKFSQFLLEADKVYQVTMKLGVRTTTGDAEGEIVSTRAVPKLKEKDLEKAFGQFRGEIQQVPSMYSAIKFQGKPLYEYARQGIEIKRESRPISIYELILIALREDEIEFKVHCSKGTYVRTLVEDVGEVLNCGAHVIALQRLSVGHFKETQMVTMETLEKTFKENGSEALAHYLLPIDAIIEQAEKIYLNPAMAFYLKQGNSLLVPHAPNKGLVQIYLKDGQFLGIGEVLPDGKIAPRRLVK